MIAAARISTCPARYYSSAPNLCIGARLTLLARPGRLAGPLDAPVSGFARRFS